MGVWVVKTKEGRFEPATLRWPVRELEQSRAAYEWFSFLVSVYEIQAVSRKERRSIDSFPSSTSTLQIPVNCMDPKGSIVANS